MIRRWEVVSALKHLEDCSTKAGGLHDNVKISGIGTKNLCCKIFHVQYKECKFGSNERVEGGVVVQAVVHGSGNWGVRTDERRRLDVSSVRRE